jgi:hypothetical protein
MGAAARQLSAPVVGSSAAAAAAATPLRPHRLALGSRKGESDDQHFMFEEEDGIMPRVSAGVQPVSARCVLGQVPSLGSSLSSSADEFSFGLLPSSGSPMVTGTPNAGAAVAGVGMQAGASAVQAGSSVALAGPELATSVHVAEGGFLWRRYKARSAAKQRAGAARSSAGKRSQGGARNNRTRYPPPVAAFSPESLNGLFTDMDDSGWAAFMRQWSESLDDAMCSGRLRSRLADTPGPVAQSCPRF